MSRQKKEAVAASDFFRPRRNKSDFSPAQKDGIWKWFRLQWKDKESRDKKWKQRVDAGKDDAPLQGSF